MDDKSKELRGKLVKSLDAAVVPLTTIALLGLADEFYSKDQRQALYAEHQALCSAESAAREQVMAEIELDPGLSYEVRVKKYGDEEADRHLAPKVAAMKAMSDAEKATRRFEYEHPLIVRLLNARFKTGRHPNEQA